MYVQSEGRVVYLIRPTQQGGSYFGSDFTHYIYWVLHNILFTIFGNVCFFLIFFKVRKIVNYLHIHLKTCKFGQHEPWLAKYNVPSEMASFQGSQLIQ